jgi:FAD-dependent urate hydroxylase
MIMHGSAGCRPAHQHLAVIGAGPFGLALASRLHAAHADFTLFGKVMSSWREHVPKGTCLLSDRWDLSFSRDGLDMTAYEKARGAPITLPIPAEEFAAYGVWFQQTACLSPDERTVIHVAKTEGGFAIRVEDGDEIAVAYIVVAIGMKPFAFRPPEFTDLASELVSHTADLHDLSRFQGKKVAVIGCGQSALECAALLAENDAEVEVIARSRSLRWLAAGHAGSLPRRPAGITAGLDAPRALWGRLYHPDVYMRLPSFARDFLLKRMLRPAASVSLKARLGPVRFTLSRGVTAARVKDDRVELHLDDQTIRIIDHVVLGTGYKVDVNAIPFLAPELRREIRTRNGYPILNSWMESSVPGLYFVGVAAAWNLGPVMWFVQRAPWAAARITRALGYSGSLASKEAPSL